MPVQIVNGGRYSAGQKLSEAEFVRFVATCRNAPAPSSSLKALIRKTRQLRSAGSRRRGLDLAFEVQARRRNHLLVLDHPHDLVV